MGRSRHDPTASCETVGPVGAEVVGGADAPDGTDDDDPVDMSDGGVQIHPRSLNAAGYVLPATVEPPQMTS
jgi:hypothetical protein